MATRAATTTVGAVSLPCHTSMDLTSKENVPNEFRQRITYTNDNSKFCMLSASVSQDPLEDANQKGQETGSMGGGLF